MLLYTFCTYAHSIRINTNSLYCVLGNSFFWASVFINDCANLEKHWTDSDAYDIRQAAFLEQGLWMLKLSLSLTEFISSPGKNPFNIKSQGQDEVTNRKLSVIIRYTRNKLVYKKQAFTSPRTFTASASASASSTVWSRWASANFSNLNFSASAGLFI